MTPEQAAAPLSMPALCARVVEKANKMLELEARATKGPWDSEGDYVEQTKGGLPIADLLDWGADPGEPQANGRLICAARNSFGASARMALGLAGIECRECGGRGAVLQWNYGPQPGKSYTETYVPCPGCAPRRKLLEAWLQEVGEYV